MRAIADVFQLFTTCLYETSLEPSRRSSKYRASLHALRSITGRGKRICIHIQFTFLIADLEISDDQFPNLVRVFLPLLPNTHLVYPGRDIPRAKSPLSRVASTPHRLCAFTG